MLRDMGTRYLNNNNLSFVFSLWPERWDVFSLTSRIWEWKQKWKHFWVLRCICSLNVFRLISKPSVFLSACLYISLSFCLSVFIPLCLFVFLSLYLSVCLQTHFDAFRLRGSLVLLETRNEMSFQVEFFPQFTSINRRTFREHFWHE